MNIKRITSLVCIIFCFFASHAQSYNVTATLDSNRILIGDQIHVDFTLTTPAESQFILPAITNELLNTYGIELVSASKTDTTLTDKSANYHVQWTITAFDSGRYVFPSIPLLSPDSQLLAQSEALVFDVNTIAVDTTAAIRDIKSIAKVPLTFREILPYLLITLAAAAVIALLVWFIIKHKRKNKPAQKQAKPKTKKTVRADIKAMRRLEKLKQKKLWQNGQIKQYYSELTEIMRSYIDDRFHINAMEMITPDILEAMKAIDLPDTTRNELSQMLESADLVKFAKMEPLPDDHDRCFNQAVAFVKLTAEPAENQNNKQVK